MQMSRASGKTLVLVLERAQVRRPLQQAGRALAPVPGRRLLHRPLERARVQGWRPLQLRREPVQERVLPLPQPPLEGEPVQAPERVRVQALVWDNCKA